MDLYHRLDYAIQGDTLVAPYHKSDDRQSLRQFDFVVSNPPFKMDFSGTREKIAAQPARFWAVCLIFLPRKRRLWLYYTCFIQHVINSLKDTGKGCYCYSYGVHYG